ncbi:hypothetical protein Ahy_B01g052737 [Arachis hypogaea]|uniref:Uncharacterized protein n=1 Tax=Arachis hypogaea TaxID=3818 RepID=A0A445AQ77_ARAHY|nr:hypothetical protein Ahy_B01g052737 [Arachis hypogaea]
MLHEKIPGCDLKANPHIESRVKLLKRQYFTIVEMMGTTGSGFENVTQAVATMEAKREATLSDRQVNENTQVNLEETEMEYEADSQEPPTLGVPAAPGASAAPSSSAAPSASYIERNKRKRGSKSEEVIDIHEKEGAERRMKLMALLRDVPGLSSDDRMKAGLSILRDNSLIDMVFQLQPGELLPFLKKLL